MYESKKEWVLVLEWAEGGELFAHLASLGRVLADAEARAFFVQIAAAVLACHQVPTSASASPYCIMHILLYSTLV